MERRLLKAIINPAMIASWVFGLWLAWELQAWQDGWFHAKFHVCPDHVRCSRPSQQLCEEIRPRREQKVAALLPDTQRSPTVLMIGIVIFVIVKPF